MMLNWIIIVFVCTRKIIFVQLLYNFLHKMLFSLPQTPPQTRPTTKGWLLPSQSKKHSCFFLIS